jgi:hypothetical protein
LRIYKVLAEYPNDEKEIFFAFTKALFDQDIKVARFALSHLGETGQLFLHDFFNGKSEE